MRVSDKGRDKTRANMTSWHVGLLCPPLFLGFCPNLLKFNQLFSSPQYTCSSNYMLIHTKQTNKRREKQYLARCGRATKWSYRETDDEARLRVVLTSRPVHAAATELKSTGNACEKALSRMLPAASVWPSWKMSSHSYTAELLTYCFGTANFPCGSRAVTKWESV